MTNALYCQCKKETTWLALQILIGVLALILVLSPVAAMSESISPIRITNSNIEINGGTARVTLDYHNDGPFDLSGILVSFACRTSDGKDVDVYARLARQALDKPLTDVAANIYAGFTAVPDGFPAGAEGSVTITIDVPDGLHCCDELILRGSD